MGQSSSPVPEPRKNDYDPQHWRVDTRSALLSVGIAAVEVAAWLGLLSLSISRGGWSWAFTPVVVAAQSWLSVGLFIVAHDCMHGSFVPQLPAFSRAVGTFTLFIYCGIDYALFSKLHSKHHHTSGTEEDPDFYPAGPASFWPWYVSFMMSYSTPVTRAYIPVLFGCGLLYGLSASLLLLYWVLPVLLSSIQMFYFATYLPHRWQAHEAFPDRHRVRSTRYARLAWVTSLLTCWHTGCYHAEHHVYPRIPFWAMPPVFDSRPYGPPLLVA